MFYLLFFLVFTTAFTQSNFDIAYKDLINYSVFIPNDAVIKTITGYNDSVTFSNFNLNNSISNKDYMIRLDSKYTFSDCPDIGVSNPKEFLMNDGTKVINGKVDYDDKYPGMDFPLGYEQVCWPSLNGHAYAMCAQNTSSVAVICIRQAFDDPMQAKQIFESFRWLDEETTSSSTQSTESLSSTVTVSSVSSESSVFSLFSSSSSEVAIEPTPVTPQPWYVRFWQWLLSWF